MNRTILLSLSVFMNISSLVSKETEDTKCLMERLYASMSGFDLAAGEAEEMTKDPNCHAAPTYGEILFDSLKKVLDDLKLTRNDVFYDLGAGIGKVATQTYLTTPVKKSVGVELSRTRHSKAETIKKELQSSGKLDKNRQLMFINKNIQDVDLSDATVVFMCSTCFSEKLMEMIVNKLNRNSNKRLQIITLKSLPTQGPFKLERTYTLPMTWSNGSLVHVYTRA